MCLEIGNKVAVIDADIRGFVTKLLIRNTSYTSPQPYQKQKPAVLTGLKTFV